MISVIVPTYNRTTCLFDMLKSLNSQKEKDFEIIVVDQSEEVSNEKVESILASCSNITYYHINERGRSLSKNFGIEKAKGDILLFCDDDIIVDENFIYTHARLHHEHPEVGAISCHLIEPHERAFTSKMPLDITFYGRFINKACSIYEGYVFSLNGGNMSFKLDAIEIVGYFDENLCGTSMLEEPDIALRLRNAGFKLFFSSSTIVKHFPQFNGNINTRRKGHIKWQEDYYINQYLFMLKNRRTHYLPFIFTYLFYRTFIEIVKYRIFSAHFILLPISSYRSAKSIWKTIRKHYEKFYFTNRFLPVKILKSVTNIYELS